MKDSIQVATNVALDGCHDSNVWKYVAIAEFVIIIALLLRMFVPRCVKSERSRQKEKIMREGDIDFGNVINSSFGAKGLYDELKGKCHPDKFAYDDELNAKATEIFSLLVKNKYDYAALCGLKKRATEELGVK